MHIAFPMGKKYEGVKIVAYIFWTSTMLTPHEKGGDNVIVFFQDYHVQLCLFISSRDTPRSLVLQNKCLSVSSFIHTYSDASNDPEKFFIHELFMNSHLHQHTVLKRILMCVLSPSLPKHQALRCKTHLQQGCLETCPGLITNNQVEMPLVPEMLQELLSTVNRIAIYCSSI
jgi:hypothetical protein